MKHIKVSAAIIHHGGCILATQRGSGEFKDLWEFPGGKIEPGETPQNAIIREIHEELGVSVIPEMLIDTVEHDYPAFHLTMHCFLSSIESGRPQLLEHSSSRWLKPDELDSVNWLPADLNVIEKLKDLLAKGKISL